MKSYFVINDSDIIWNRLNKSGTAADQVQVQVQVVGITNT
jgi:hypothetical protein